MTDTTPDRVSDCVGTALCRGCGTCVAVCPVGALSLQLADAGFTVTCDEASCTGCGLCVRVCPALEPPRIVAPEDADRTEALIGDCLAVYLGFAADDAMRETGTSGGIATELVLHALENDIIDGAVLNRLDHERGVCMSFIARNREEVIAAAGSKYCPSTTNEALAKTGDQAERLALVGLPCQVTGAAKAAGISKTFGRVKLRIGLFCSHGITKHGLPFLLDRFAAGYQDIARVAYRSEGWPGSLIVEYASGERRTIPHHVYWGTIFGPYFFTPYGCLLCSDLAAEDADIALADAWLPEVTARDSIGTSLIVVRSERGMDLMDSLLAERRIVAARVEPSEVVRAQAGILARKKRGIAARVRLARMLGLDDRAGLELPAAKSAALPGAAIVYLNAWTSSRRWGRWLLGRMPMRIRRFYASCVQALTSRYN